MDSFLRNWLGWPIIEHFHTGRVWAWPLCETFHFVGICILIGAVGMFDLRVLGLARGLPIAALRRFLPWGVFGFGFLCCGRVFFRFGLSGRFAD